MASLNFMNQDKNKRIYDILVKVASDEGCFATMCMVYALNVEGPRAGLLECAFGKQGMKVMKICSKACMHIRAIGCKVPMPKEGMANSSLTVDDKKDKTEDEMIRDLINCHEKLIEKLTKDITTMKDLKEPDCELFLTKALDKHKKLMTYLKVHKEKSYSPKSA